MHIQAQAQSHTHTHLVVRQTLKFSTYIGIGFKLCLVKLFIILKHPTTPGVLREKGNVMCYVGQ